jgi:hypothetical protein
MRPPLRVSDHALVRFLARAGGYEVEAVRAALAASLARAARAAGTIGSGDYVIRADGLSYIVRDGVLVTVARDRSREPPPAGKQAPPAQAWPRRASE